MSVKDSKRRTVTVVMISAGHVVDGRAAVLVDHMPTSTAERAQLGNLGF